MSNIIKGMIFGVAAMLLVGIVAWLTLAYSGVYNVAATDTHTDPVRWMLETTMRRSITNRAAGVNLPKSFSEELIAEGASHYVESCAHCHGAPGQDPTDWSRSMRPKPPHLVEAAKEWTPEEIHWIVENGIKMTGMPAFGPHHNNAEILAITAFVAHLPSFSPEEYKALTSEGHGHSHRSRSPHRTGPTDETVTK